MDIAFICVILASFVFHIINLVKIGRLEDYIVYLENINKQLLEGKIRKYENND